MKHIDLHIPPSLISRSSRRIGIGSASQLGRESSPLVAASFLVTSPLLVALLRFRRIFRLFRLLLLAPLILGLGVSQFTHRGLVELVDIVGET